MSITLYRNNINQNSNINKQHKNYTKLPELKIKKKYYEDNNSPIRIKRYIPIFNSPENLSSKYKINNKNNNNNDDNDIIERLKTFSPNSHNIKSNNNELFSSTDRELSTNIKKKKTKSILKKTTFINENEHEQKNVKFIFDENNHPLTKVFVIKKSNNYNNKNAKDMNNLKQDVNEDNNINNELCKCDSCYIF